jgi:hypothetical protein
LEEGSELGVSLILISFLAKPGGALALDFVLEDIT